ncbi:hypothetical protein DYBT9623_03193 [Dyadobacter sp. CECT 9623]|uniref:Uncharacterized protein n=1 Tax=Dyadobacter linearis TaxID=2823330 RepID=A0ABN7RER7_9BACT|nr:MULTISPECIES: hypothetical protein [unclassified Dyadobacter]MCE7061539.1 hypothetical protein [Dyadobacter sp. CY343]CAG5070648.1 hypothetical protein DYBT9623_03193 [Dyadobacter sp. CECT 9623]
MIHEKIFHLKSGREVKVVVKGYFLNDNPQVSTDYEVFIKDPKETFFRTPIGANHPQYWKMRRSTPQQAKVLLLEYSGISQRQVSQAIAEFNKIATFPPAQIGLHYENELV